MSLRAKIASGSDAPPVWAPPEGFAKGSPDAELARRVVERLVLIAFPDIRELYGPDQRLKPMSELTAEQAAAIASIKTREWVTKNGNPGFEVTCRVYDAVRALQMLGDYAEVWKQAASGRGFSLLVLLPGMAAPVPIEEATARGLLAPSRGLVGRGEVVP